ncbi:MAG: YtxH domain-containing protein [Microbacteriaceae bacterium]
MKGKILLVVGLGVGYVLGTRAGRDKYEEMKAAASAFWNDPRVKAQVDNVEDFVKDKAPDVSEFFVDSAKTLAHKVTGSRSSTKTTAKSGTSRKAAPKATASTVATSQTPASRSTATKSATKSSPAK